MVALSAISLSAVRDKHVDLLIRLQTDPDSGSAGKVISIV